MLSKSNEYQQLSDIEHIIKCPGLYFGEMNNKENIRHIRVKMLSRVNDNFLYIREIADGSTDHGCFYELRACAYDSNYFHVVNYDFLFP